MPQSLPIRPLTAAAMRPSEALERNRQAIRETVLRNKAANPRVFGSVARGEDRIDSDLDILVDALPGTTLFDLGGLLEELKVLMSGTEIHLLTPGDFPEKVRLRVIEEAKPI